MSKVCEVCGKAPVAGRNVSHSHRVTNRVVENGRVFKKNVCTKCLKAGKVTRA